MTHNKSKQGSAINNSIQLALLGYKKHKGNIYIFFKFLITRLNYFQVIGAATTYLVILIQFRNTYDLSDLKVSS